MTHLRKRAVSVIAATAVLGLALTASAHADPNIPTQAPSSGLTDQQITDLETRLSELSPQIGQDTGEAAAPENVGTTSSDELSFQEKSVMETNLGLGALAPLGGTDDQLMIHTLGTVTRQNADGDIIWRHTAGQFYDDWQVTTDGNPRWRAEPAFRISLGGNTVGLSSGAADRGYATGDLNGDRVDDIAFIAQVGINPYRPMIVRGETLPYGTFVSVLDGQTGTMLWHKMLTYAQQVSFVDGTLVVSNQAYGNNKSPADLNAKLYGYTFAKSGEALTATEKWSIDTGSHTAVWAALENAGKGRLAASWNERPVQGQPTIAHLALLNASTGAIVWDVATPQVPRAIRYDAGRDLLVTTEQMGFAQGVQYALSTFTASNGTRRVVSTRVNALAISLLVADVAGSGDAEYIVGESLLNPYLYVHVSQVRATDGDGDQLWTYAVKRAPDNGHDGPIFFDLDAADGIVVATWLGDETRGRAGLRDSNLTAGITAIDGRDGDVAWEKKGTKSSTMFTMITGGRHPEVVTVAGDQTRYTYDLWHGAVRDTTPTLGELSHIATVDLTGDGVKDVVAGGEAHGVFAIDGTTLNANPKILWRATTPGSVLDIKVADVRGDDRPEVIVAASTATVVIDSSDGDVESKMDGRGALIWQVTVANIDRDADNEIVVPSDGLRAYDGDGERLWSYGAKDTRVFSTVSVADGTVYAMYGTRADSGAAAEAVAVALDSRKGKERWVVHQDTAEYLSPQLNNSVLADPAIPYADGHAVAMAWSNTGEGWDASTIVEIRDGRTGEVIQKVVNGGQFTHNHFLTGTEGLIQVRAVVFSLFDGTDTVQDTPLIQNPFQAAFATGPNGERLIVSANEGYLSMWNSSILTSGRIYPSSIASTHMGTDTWGLTIDDLDADGTQEVIGFGFDRIGYDLVLDLTGGGFYSSNLRRHGVNVFTIAAP